MVMMVIVIYAVSMPLFLLAIVAVVEKSLTDTFVDEVRIRGRVFADHLETIEFDKAFDEAIAILDSAILGGGSNYAAIEINGVILESSILGERESGRFQEDFSFAEHEDETYFLSLPLFADAGQGSLRLGFDEVPIYEHLAQVRSTVMYILVAYLIAIIVLTMLLSRRIVKPIRRLKRASRKVALGDYERKLDVDSDIFEIQELTNDLEKMRSNLVGVNARLIEEIREREFAEAEQRVLETQLRHAQRLESLGTLAGGVAHEFNNVLQPMILYTDLALEDMPEDSDTSTNLRRVMELASRAKELSHKILTFGRQDTEKLLSMTCLVPVVEEAMSMIRALLPATVNLMSDIDDEVGLVLCDPAEIQQLLVNLCNNAFQALGDVGNEIRIRLGGEVVSSELASKLTHLEAGEYVVLEVSDTGKGMDEKTVERVFEPFFTTQDVGEGTGLGMSVVHGIVMRHNGEISVESGEGKGTRVRVYLPIADESRIENE